MTELYERNLKLNASAAKMAVKFDDNGAFYHNRFGMLPVDFVVEITSHYIFVEVKDPEGARDMPNVQRAKFREDVNTEQFNQKCYRKYRDSYLYLHFAGSLNEKPIICVLLLCAPWVDQVLRSNKSEQISKQIPTHANCPAGWTHAVMETFLVLSIEEWNKFLPRLPIERVSEGV